MRKKILFLFFLITSSLIGMGQKQQQLVDLPLEILPAQQNANRPMVLFITGDGGWKDFDPALAKKFVQNNVPVVALNALHYFWTKKDPNETTKAIESILYTYLQQWNKKKFILVGYSFGADVLPFVINRLPKDLQLRCDGVVLFSPGTSTDFEIHISQMLNNHRQWEFNVINEIKEMKAYKMLCFFGTEERDFPISILKRPNCQVIYLPGGHHYDNPEKDLAKEILDKLKE